MPQHILTSSICPFPQLQAALLPQASPMSCTSPAMPNPKTDPKNSPVSDLVAAGIQLWLCLTPQDAATGVDQGVKVG